jgi:hypothetical protein
MVKPAADASVNSQSIGFHRPSSLTTVTGVGKFRTLQSVNSRHHRQDAIDLLRHDALGTELARSSVPLRNMRAAHRLQPGNLRAANGVKRQPASPRLTHFDAHARYPGGFGKAKGETPGCTGGRMTINKQSGPGHG